MHQMSMGVRCCTDSLHNTQKRIMGAAHTRTVNYEIRDPALRVGGGKKIYSLRRLSRREVVAMVFDSFANHYHAICTYTMQTTSGRRDNTK